MSKEITILNELSTAFTEFKRSNDSRLDELEARITRPPGGRASGGGAEKAALFQASLRNGAKVTESDLREYQNAFASYLRVGDHALPSEIKAALSIGSDPDGGYVVNPDLTGRIVERIRELSPMRQYASVETISTDALEGLRDQDEADSGWVGETESRTDTDAGEIGKWRISVFEIYAQPKATQRLLDDASIDVEGWLAGKVGRRFARQEAQSFVTSIGDGVLRPRGILSYPVSTADDDSRIWGEIQYVPTGASGAFASSNPTDVFDDAEAALATVYRANAIWAMNRKTAAAVRKLKDADGRSLWERSLQSGQPPMLLGYPVVIFDDLPDIAADSLSILFGDFGGIRSLTTAWEPGCCAILSRRSHSSASTPRGVWAVT